MNMNMNTMQSINLIQQVNMKQTDNSKVNTKDIKTSDKENITTNNDKSTFKEVLKAEKNSNISSNDEKENLVDKVELEEDDLKDLTIEDVIDCLSRLVEMLVSTAQKSDEVTTKTSFEGETIEFDMNQEVSSIILDVLNKNLITKDMLTGNETLAIGKEGIITFDTAKDVNSKEVMNIVNNLLEILKDDNVKANLDQSSLKSFDVLLNKLAGEVSKVSEAELPIIKEVIKEVKTLLIKIKEDSIEKLDITNIKVVDVKSESKQTDSEQSQKQSSTKDIKETVLKEDKVLKSILGDEEETKINRFSSFAGKTLSGKVESVQAPIINKATLVQDVIKSVKYMDNNALKQLTVRINPVELGEIAIKLVQEDGTMKATIKANSRDTFSLLSQNLNDIRKSLGEHNIKIAEVNIELYNDDTTFYKDSEFNNNFFNEQKGNENGSNKNLVSALEDDQLEQGNEIEDLSNINILA